MTGWLALAVQALILVALPYALWRLGRLEAVVPWVFLQILVGVALGPSLLGRWAPDLAAWLFSPATRAPLVGIGTLAALLFAFVTGLHLDRSWAQGPTRGFAWIVAASILVPTGLGLLAGLVIAARFPEIAGAGTGTGRFACAIGICTGVTALPVLGAILRELGLLREPLGRQALALAACNDAALWLLLTALLLGGSAQAAGLGILLPLLGLALLIAALRWPIQPLIARVQARGSGPLDDGGLVMACAVALAAAAVTEALGLHALLGAFLAGWLMPQALKQPLLDRLEMVAIVVLMPFFFILVGLGTRIEPGSGSFLAVLALVTAAAVLGKVGGTAAAARLLGADPRTALALGALMQTKGMMEVVVASMLRDAGIIGPAMFSVLILMALVSTGLAMPMTRAALGRRAPAPAV